MTPNDPTPDKASGSRQANRSPTYRCVCGARYNNPDVRDLCCASPFTTAVRLCAETPETTADVRGGRDV